MLYIYTPTMVSFLRWSHWSLLRWTRYEADRPLLSSKGVVKRSKYEVDKYNLEYMSQRILLLLRDFTFVATSR